MSTSDLSNLDLIKACDSFPYDGSSGPHYKLFLPDDDGPHGFVLPEIVQFMPWSEDFVIDHQNLTIHLQDSSNGSNTGKACTAAFTQTVNAAIDQDVFTVLHGKHSELYPIVGARYPVRIERFAADLFGIISRGAHLTVYTRTKDGMNIWVPRRSPKMFTFPNKLDTTVAGGVPVHQTPFENVVAEADEEASLPAELIRQHARPVGALTYMGLSSEANGGKERLITPDIVYCYDLEVGEDVVPRPRDEEVKEFMLMGVEGVRRALRTGEFKTNSAVVMLDFFIRHGFITAEDEVDYVEIVTRMHRRMPFPTHA